jgi:Dolichyl-phosphate-mannose-protein mannosyltransferase
LYLLKDRSVLAMVFFGIAFSIKAQPLFLGPFLFLLFLRKRLSFSRFLIVPVVYMSMMLPAIYMGRPALELLLAYGGQASKFQDLTANAPTLYAFIPNSYYDVVGPIGFVFTAIWALLWSFFYARRLRSFPSGMFILAAFVSLSSIPFLLPKMHDRYFYLADVASLLVAMYYPSLWFLTVGYQIVSGMAYYVFLVVPSFDPFGDTILKVAALLNLAVVLAGVWAQWQIAVRENLFQEMRFLNQTFVGIKKIFYIFWGRLQKNQISIFFFLILCIGIYVRFVDLGDMPQGLNPDEASIAIDAYYLSEYGTDRYGVSYPIHLIAWGSGQNAFYAYIILPLIALWGTGSFVVRLPMAIAGVFSLVLCYLAGKRLFNERFALLAMFCMAVSPWHIVNSRWAVESNIMPFLFLLAFTALVFSEKTNWWFVVSCGLFAVTLYSYGTTYVAVPFFLLLVIPMLLKSDRITTSQLVWGAGVFVLLALPIGLFLVVNTFELPSIHIGTVTIPRLPVEPRYETMSVAFGKNVISTLWNNARVMWRLLLLQSDDYPWNFVEPFGYFYKVTFPFLFAGFLLMLPLRGRSELRVERWLIAAWFLAALAVGLAHPVNLTRLNIIQMPVIFCMAMFIYWLDKKVPNLLPAFVTIVLVAFLLFLNSYFGEEYRKKTANMFNLGIIPAMEYAVEETDSLVCVTDQNYALYIYALLSQKYEPADYVGGLTWVYPKNPEDPARRPHALMQFRFSESDCVDTPEAVYILFQDETPPENGINYKQKKFERFRVFVPKNP